MARSRKVRSDFDPLNSYVNRTWRNILLHTVNSPQFRLNKHTQSYAKYGIRVEMTREQFKMWCKDQREQINSLKRPSLDRIDSRKHYSLDNIRIIELRDNVLGGAATKRKTTGELIQKLALRCKYCHSLLKRRVSQSGQIERLNKFISRNYCDRHCSALAREGEKRGQKF